MLTITRSAITAEISSITGHPFLSVSRLELLDAVLNLCAYHHPKDIILPAGYVAGFSIILQILCSYSPSIKLTETNANIFTLIQYVQKHAELDASSILMNIMKCTIKSKKTSVSTVQLGLLLVSFFKVRFVVTVATMPGGVNRILCIQGSNASWKPLNFESKLLRPWKVLENLFYSFLVLESPWIFIDPHFQSLKTSVKVISPSSHVIQMWRAGGWEWLPVLSGMYMKFQMWSLKVLDFLL